MTVITLPRHRVDANWLNETVHDFLARDDVYTIGFTTGNYAIIHRKSAALTLLIAFYFQGHRHDGTQELLKPLFKSFGTTRVIWGSKDRNDNSTPLPDGPYFATRSGLHRAWRLYEDHTNSFVLPMIQSADDINTYEVLAAKDRGIYGSTSIAVPSRLFYKPTSEQPLAGQRIGVKDQYAVKGVLTTYGSRSYAMTYPPSNVTSGAIQNLIDMGAIIVGKTKLPPYANAWFSIAQWPDYSLPFVSYFIMMDFNASRKLI